MHRLRNPLALALLLAALAAAPGRAAAVTYYIEVQFGGPGTVTPSGIVEVAAGANQTFTFTPSGCHVVGDVTVDDVSVGSGLAEYTFTNVQSDHLLYVAFGSRSTTTTLDVRPAFGQCAVPETLTAHVANADGGLVKFFNGTTPLLTTTVTSGIATYIQRPGLQSGSYTFSASYLGTACSFASDSPVVPYDVADTGPTPLTLTLALSASLVQLSNSVALNTTLTIGGSVATAQRGLVTFLDGLTGVGNAGMVNGVTPSQQFYPTTPGVHVLTAVAELSPCVVTVVSAPETLLVYVPKAATEIQLIVSPRRVEPGGVVQLAAAIDPRNATGVVHFMDLTHGVEMATVPIVEGWWASIMYEPVTGGPRYIQARYDGDSLNQGCTSDSVYLDIGSPTPTVMSLSISPPRVDPGGSVTLSATISPSSAGGIVYFWDVTNSGEVAAVPLVNGTASCTYGPLSGTGRFMQALYYGTIGVYTPCQSPRVYLGVGTPPTLFAAPYLSFLTGTNPRGLAIGDLNADGRPDVVTANQGENSASVLLGNGDGTFQPKTDIAAGGGPQSVAIADLNGDGKPDLAVATGSGVSVLLGIGDGTFGPPTNFGNGYESVAIGDLNADGRPDLAASSYYHSTVSALLGNGDGTFGAPSSFRTGIFPQSISIADLDGDGKPDLATADADSFYQSVDRPFSGGSVSVLLGNGDGTFGTRRGYRSSCQSPYSLAIADLNADGRLDAVTADRGYDGPCRQVSVLLGNGDGTLGSSNGFNIFGMGPISVVAADLDADGRPDLAEVNDGSGGGAVSVLLGNGDGTFQPMVDYGAGGYYAAVASGDLNGDRRTDLVVTNYLSNSVMVLLHVEAGPTATLQAQFDATTATEGIELRWSFGDASRVAAAAVERSSDAAGPWLPIAPALRRDGDMTVALDRATDPGGTYFYRLNVKLVDGSSVTFGPIASTSSAFIGESALNFIAPNPARAASQVQYTVARAGHVRLEVTDVAGRVVATLVDGTQRPGRFQLAWDGTSRGAMLPAGLYFVRLTTLDRTITRKLTRLQ